MLLGVSFANGFANARVDHAGSDGFLNVVSAVIR